MNHIFRVSFFHTATGRLVLLALVIGLFLLPEFALASNASKGEALPYEDGLIKFTDSLTGPVAFGISLVGIVAAGAMLIFGSDMSGFLRSMIFLILVIAIIINAAGIIKIIKSDAAMVADISGATISSPSRNERLLT